MRVLFLTNNPNLGSTARILQSWIQLGAQNGVEARVVIQHTGEFSKWLDVNGVSHRVQPMPLPNARWPFPSLWHAWRVARWARKHGVQIIHCNEHDLYLFGVLLRRFLGLPLVCHVRFHIARQYCEWVFGGGRRMPDALLWTSRQQQKDCAEAVAGLVPPERQEIVHLGMDLTRFGTLSAGRDQTRRSWDVGPDDIVIGTASALRPIKRIEDFISMVAELGKKEPRVVGVIAGDAMPGEEAHRDKLLRQIHDTGLGPRLRWLGHLEPIEPFHHAIDVFVSTSSYETFGNSVCEAMACRRPVVAYRGGSVQEVVGDAGRIVETGDVPALTSAVGELIRRPELRNELGERSRERVGAHFNPAVSLEKLKRVYQSIYSNRNGENQT